VIAVISFPDNANIEEITDRYMKSPEFADDMTALTQAKSLM